ncbi:TRAP transporter small permease subunit [Roseobacter fucihabitans]
MNVHATLSPNVSRLVSRMITVKSWFAVIACLIMAVTFFFVVIFRYLFDADLFAYEEWLLIICFWLYFMGSAIGTFEGSHVNADLLSYVINDPKKAHIRAILVTAIELIVTLALVYWAVLMLIDEISSYPRWRTTIALRIPFFVPRLAILVGFGFMAFYSALHLYARIRTGPEEATP